MKVRKILGLYVMTKSEMESMKKRISDLNKEKTALENELANQKISGNLRDIGYNDPCC